MEALRVVSIATHAHKKRNHFRLELPDDGLSLTADADRIDPQRWRQLRQLVDEREAGRGEPVVDRASFAYILC